MSDPAPILWLDELRLEHLLSVGGKLARLGELAGRGYPVPPGFAVPVEAFQLAVPDDVRREIGLISHHAPSSLAGLEAAATSIRELIEGQPLPGWLEDEVAEAYEHLVERCGLGPELPLAIRSSGVGEDAGAASFAGQFDTYLGVRGAVGALEHVKRCWASQYSARALDYCRRQGLRPDERGIAVGVLQLLSARSSGIAFSINPVDGNSDQAVVEASWGLGEAVVSGRVTPDCWVVEKSTGRIVEERIADKELRSVFDEAAGRVVDQEAPESLRTEPALSHDEVRHVAEVAAAIEQQEGCPQDVEWAFDERLAFPRNFFLLQHRPETVWSRQPESTPFDPVEYALRNVFGVLPEAGSS